MHVRYMYYEIKSNLCRGEEEEVWWLRIMGGAKFGTFYLARRIVSFEILSLICCVYRLFFDQATACV